MDKVIELIAQHGIWSVVGAALLYIFVKIAPEAYKYIQRKKEKEDEQEIEEKKLDSVFVVFGVDENKDIWMYSVFKTEAEAQAYRDNIKSVIESDIVLLINECEFNKPIKGFEAYNPYSQKYFGTTRCVIDTHVVAEKTTPSSHTIHSSSADQYKKIRDWMESKADD